MDTSLSRCSGDTKFGNELCNTCEKVMFCLQKVSFFLYSCLKIEKLLPSRSPYTFSHVPVQSEKNPSRKGKSCCTSTDWTTDSFSKKDVEHHPWSYRDRMCEYFRVEHVPENDKSLISYQGSFDPEWFRARICKCSSRRTGEHPPCGYRWKVTSGR